MGRQCGWLFPIVHDEVFVPYQGEQRQVSQFVRVDGRSPPVNVFLQEEFLDVCALRLSQMLRAFKRTSTAILFVAESGGAPQVDTLISTERTHEKVKRTRQNENCATLVPLRSDFQQSCLSNIGLQRCFIRLLARGSN